MTVYYVNIDEDKDLDPIEIEDWCETFNSKAHIIFFGLDISSAKSIEKDLGVLIQDFEDGINICKALIDSFKNKKWQSVDSYSRSVFSWSKSDNNYAVIIKNHTMFEMAMQEYSIDYDPNGKGYSISSEWTVHSDIADNISSREKFFVKVASYYLDKFTLEKTIDLVEDKQSAKFKI